MSTSKPTPIRKGTVVRVTDADNYGATFIVSRIGRTKNTPKDGGLYTVYGDGLTGGRFEVDSKSVAPIADIGPKDQMTMDAAVVERRVKYEQEQAERREAQRAKVAAELEEIRVNGEAWRAAWADPATSTVEKGLRYDGAAYEVKVVGPSWEITKKSGEVIKGRDDMRVRADVQRGFSSMSYLLPQDERPVVRTVNWAAMGDVSPVKARVYALMILRACDLAETAEFEQAPRPAGQEDA